MSTFGVEGYVFAMPEERKMPIIGGLTLQIERSFVDNYIVASKSFIRGGHLILKLVYGDNYLTAVLHHILHLNR